jgi:hypothetical protein
MPTIGKDILFPSVLTDSTLFDERVAKMRETESITKLWLPDDRKRAVLVAVPAEQTQTWPSQFPSEFTKKITTLRSITLDGSFDSEFHCASLEQAFAPVLTTPPISISRYAQA